jgi:hypothetical protein
MKTDLGLLFHAPMESNGSLRLFFQPTQSSDPEEPFLKSNFCFPRRLTVSLRGVRVLLSDLHEVVVEIHGLREVLRQAPTPFEMISALELNS